MITKINQELIEKTAASIIYHLFQSTSLQDIEARRLFIEKNLSEAIEYGVIISMERIAKYARGAAYDELDMLREELKNARKG